MELSLEEKKALDILLNEVADIVIGEYCTHCKICENKDMECCYIKAIDTTYNLVKKQQKEIEEKSTIIMAGAEKVKQLEKGNRSLMESRIKWKNRYYKEKAKNKEYISKDKIREKIKELEEQFKKYENEGLSGFVSKIDKGTRIEVLQELLEEN